MQGYSNVTIKEEYEPVAAYTVSPQAEGASGGGSGEVTKTIRVEWTETGITGISWYTNITYGPFYGQTDLTSRFLNGEDLAKYFDSWMATDEQKNDFVKKDIDNNCWNVIF